MKSTVPTENNKNIWIFPSAILFCFIALYLPAFQKMLAQWDSGDNSYAYAIIPIFFYLCWDIKDRFQFNSFSWSPWALIPGFLSIILIYIGETGSVLTLVFIGIWLAFLSVLTFLYHVRIRHLLFPILMLFFIVPLPAFINNMLTFKLKMLASTISVEMFRVAGLSVFQEGNLIDLGVEQLQVVDACSGLRYFMSMIVISLLVGYLFVKGWWRKTTLLLLVVPLSSLVNGLRIFVIGMLTINGLKKYTEDAYHDATGIIVFMVAGALLVSVAFLLKKIGPKKSSTEVNDSGGSSPTWKHLPVALSAMLCLTFASGGLAYRNIPDSATHPGRLTFENFPMEIGQWHGKKLFLDEKLVEEGLWSDDYVKAHFTRDDLPNSISLLIPFYEYQGTRHTIHAPQACLLGGGWATLSTVQHHVPVGDGKTIEIRAMTMKKGEHKLMSTYFMYQRGRIITSPWLNKYYLMLDSITRRRTDGALIRVEMLLSPDQTTEDGFTVINDFIANLWPILPNYVPN